MDTKPTIESIDITPDKSIYHKIGEANYSISDAIAEVFQPIEAICLTTEEWDNKSSMIVEYAQKGEYL